MKFYNIQMVGKFIPESGDTDPTVVAANEGRLFYNSTDNNLKFQNSTEWVSFISTSNISDSVPTIIDDIISDNIFLRKDQNDSTPYQLTMESLVVSGTTAKVDGSKIWTAGNDGAGSGLDADLLDGQQGTYYTDASNLSSGTVPSARLSGTYAISITGTATTALYA